MVPYGRYKNLKLETRAKEHFVTGELNAKMRSKKVFDFGGCFLASSVGILLWIILSLTELWENALWLAFPVDDFMASVRNRIRLRYETNEFPR